MHAGHPADQRTHAELGQLRRAQREIQMHRAHAWNENEGRHGAGCVGIEAVEALRIIGADFSEFELLRQLRAENVVGGAEAPVFGHEIRGGASDPIAAGKPCEQLFASGQQQSLTGGDRFRGSFHGQQGMLHVACFI